MTLYHSFLIKRFPYTRDFLLGKKEPLEKLATIRPKSLKRASEALTGVLAQKPEEKNQKIDSIKNASVKNIFLASNSIIARENKKNEKRESINVFSQPVKSKQPQRGVKTSQKGIKSTYPKPNLVVTKPLENTAKDSFFSSLNKHAYSSETQYVEAVKKQPDSSQPSIKTQPKSKKMVSMLLTALMIISGVVGAVIFLPNLYYELSPPDTVVIEAKESGTAQGGDFDEAIEELSPGRAYVPPVDQNLPEGDWLVIPRIGVRTELRKTEDPDEALSQGVWHVPEWGEAGDLEEPMIVAAHRFGWDWWWQSDYWKYNSFYLLPDTEPGDRIEVISGQRKWVYEIYSGEEGDEILDYDADMILYTCKFLNSPVRHFRYARLIDPTLSTQ